MSEEQGKFPTLEHTLRLMCAIEALLPVERDHYLAELRELRRKARLWERAQQKAEATR